MKARSLFALDVPYRRKESSISRLAQSGKVDLSHSMRYALKNVTTRHGKYFEVMRHNANGNYSIARLLYTIKL